MKEEIFNNKKPWSDMFTIINIINDENKMNALYIRYPFIQDKKQFSLMNFYKFQKSDLKMSLKRFKEAWICISIIKIKQIEYTAWVASIVGSNLFGHKKKFNTIKLTGKIDIDKIEVHLLKTPFYNEYIRFNNTRISIKELKIKLSGSSSV